MRTMYNDEGPDYAEEVFRYNPRMLTNIGNMMLKDKTIKRKYLLSFCLRNPQIINFI